MRAPSSATAQSAPPAPEKAPPSVTPLDEISSNTDPALNDKPTELVDARMEQAGDEEEETELMDPRSVASTHSRGLPDPLTVSFPLQQYVIDKVLGQGSFGITYLATDTNLDIPVAIKEYFPRAFLMRVAEGKVSSKPEVSDERISWGMDRFLQEARTIAPFKHPNIVRVLNFFETGNPAYM
ncbi:MAG: hypothetical protein HQL50_15435, partial [Magnetococcales bacterium]|nr:hypothetical protein [Magnetococcales bacterium]